MGCCCGWPSAPAPSWTSSILAAGSLAWAGGIRAHQGQDDAESDISETHLLHGHPGILEERVVEHYSHHAVHGSHHLLHVSERIPEERVVKWRVSERCIS